MFLGLVTHGALHARTVVLLCYPSDRLIETSCMNFEKQMKGCGNTVIRMDDASEAMVKARLSGLDAQIPIFISSHGLSIAGKHYLDSNKGDLKKIGLGKMDPWRLPIGAQVLEVEPGDDSNEYVFETLPILRAVEKHPKVLSACFSGRACVQAKIGGLVASCEFDETSQHTKISGIQQEPILYWLAELYCKEKVFNEVDKIEKRDGVLSQGELRKFLAKKMGGKKTIVRTLWPDRPNVDANAQKSALGLAGFDGIEAKTEIVANGDERKKRAADEAIKLKGPDKKVRAVILGQMYAAPSKDPKQKHADTPLAGFYLHPTGAEIVAKRMNLSAPAKDLGDVWAVEIEDMKIPCQYDLLGISQTPVIDSPIGQPSHK